MSTETKDSNKKQKRELNISFRDITKDNVGQVRRLNMAVLPARYNDKFYKDLSSGTFGVPNNYIIKLAYHTDVLIGAICCRIEEHTKEELQKTYETSQTKFIDQEAIAKQTGGKRLYMMTFGVLAPYRNYGVGTALIHSVVEHVQKLGDIHEVYLHVQTNNDQAVAFYGKFGFSVIAMIPKYYNRLTPPDCYILSRRFDEKKADAPPS